MVCQLVPHGDILGSLRFPIFSNPMSVETVTLDTIYFDVGDDEALDRSVAFYTQNFRLTLKGVEPGESAWLTAGPLTLGFHVGDPPSNPWACNLGFTVHDLDATCAELEHNGVGISVGPFDAPWGRAASLVDPNGFTVWLTQKS